jgi:hypothetical protein
MLPLLSIAREVTVCSPAVGLGQLRDHIFQANSASSVPSMVAGIQGPSSIFTSTRSIGAPRTASFPLAPVSTAPFGPFHQACRVNSPS